MIFQDLIRLCLAYYEIFGSWLENKFIFGEGWIIFESWQISSLSEDFFKSGALSEHMRSEIRRVLLKSVEVTGMDILLKKKHNKRLFTFKGMARNAPIFQYFHLTLPMLRLLSSNAQECKDS